MAKKKAPKPVKAPVRRRPPPRRRGNDNTSASGIFLLIGLIILAVVKPQAAMLVAVGLLPTIVLGFTGKGSHKGQRTLCVGLTNSAGIVILLGDLWSNSIGLDDMLINLNTWIIMWGGAAIGYALNYVGPLIASMILQGMAQDRIKNINQQKQDLLELWGHEVISNDDKKPDLGVGGRTAGR